MAVASDFKAACFTAAIGQVNALHRLSSAFTELRQQVDDGLLACPAGFAPGPWASAHLGYPYSTRELVNVARHLQKYRGQSIGSVLRDILDFDRHDPHTLRSFAYLRCATERSPCTADGEAFCCELRTLRDVMLRWGIPLDVNDGAIVQLATEWIEVGCTGHAWRLEEASTSRGIRCHFLPNRTRSRICRD